jgi:acyl phosphate:glycerol-3-phosphate acyltransferase
MHTLTIIAVLIASYLAGAIPFGFLIVKAFTGKDITRIESGRTGGTNAMRAGGIAAGLGTALMDGFKGAAAVWIARALLPGDVWIQLIAPLMAILGHNYSVFLLTWDRESGFHLRGGAGGATCVGGSFGLWPPSLLIILPLSGLIWYGVGYASVTTMCIALFSIFIFAYRAWLGLNPWAYVIYGVIALVMVAWSLRPNIRRLIEGKERLHGWRALKLRTAKQPSDKE